MDRQTAFLLALGLLILAAATVSVTGWILFVRDRRASRATPRGAEASHPRSSSFQRLRPRTLRGAHRVWHESAPMFESSFNFGAATSYPLA